MLCYAMLYYTREGTAVPTAGATPPRLLRPATGTASAGRVAEQRRF